MAHTAKRRPNVLFLMSDEHRADITGYSGDDVVRTPVLDELARTGVVFSNAYTPSPICIPARQCLMSGQLPKTCGCEGWIDLRPGHMTFSRRFSQYAYETVACGKLHHDGVDQMQGWTRRPAGDLNVAANYIEDKVDEEHGRFERLFAHHKWSDAKEITRAGIGISQVVNCDNEWLNSALRFIDEYYNNSHYDREQGPQPLMLKVSLAEPHYPYLTDEEKFGYYLNRVKPFIDETPSEHPFLSQRGVRPGRDASEREIRRATAAYYGMIETVDAHYGSVLDALRAVGQDIDDWIILYVSDHGEMLGEHGIWEKQKFYEASVRVPMIIRWPKGFEGGRVVSQNVNLCDLFATLCELADIPVPGQLDSRSLVPLLKGNSDDWDNETVSQFNDTYMMIKRDDLKYQYYGPEMPEVLFDLGKDPKEITSVIAEPDYADVVSHFRRRLAQLGMGA